MTHTAATLSRRVTAEGVGTALLVCCVVGSGIMAGRLFAGNIGMVLLANSLATGAVLAALIFAFGDISAQFNPAVSLSEFLSGRLPARELMAYVLAQVAGGLAGIVVAHVMFGVPVLQVSSDARSGWALWFSEGVATFGLLIVIAGASRVSQAASAVAVGAYIASAYWFTSSTSFANPAVTIARAFTDSFAGIRPIDVAPFLMAQIVGTASGFAATRWLRPAASNRIPP